MEKRPVLDFQDYAVAWIAPLDIEQKAALRMLDSIHKGNFRSDPGDDYQYIGGEINGHNIVIATFPPGTPYGGNSAAALAGQIRKCFPRLWLGFLVGIAAGLPDIQGSPSRDIRLGDVLVSLPDSASSGVTQYDSGKQTPGGFENHSHLPTTTSMLRATLHRIRTLSDFEGNLFLQHLQRKDIQGAKNEYGNSLFAYPGQDKDLLYQTIKKDQNKEKEELVCRQPRDDTSLTRVWYGNIGSGNTLMKSSKERDELRDRYKIIGLEMEAHGTMNTIPVANIRGVCDYADKHKDKDWQGYAAVVAAAYAREVLCNINPIAEHKETKQFDAIALPRNTSMVPRDYIFNQLDALLPQDNKPHRAALCGLGGIGKTQLALEFAYRRQDQIKCSLFWVHATTEARFIADYTTIARQAGLQEDLKGVELLTRVCDWLKKQTNWLLVLDNADDIGLFKDQSLESYDDNTESPGPSLLKYVPQTSAGSILWTTRDGSIERSLIGPGQAIKVGKMTDNEALRLLRGSTAANEGCEFTEASADEKKLLGSKALDALPLAITQAQAFMSANNVSVSEYIQMFDESQEEVLKQNYDDEYRTELPNSVMRTFLVSMKRIVTEQPNGEIAGRILRTIAFFDNQGIPVELIRQSACLGNDGFEETLSKFRIENVLGRLVQYSFLQAQNAVTGTSDRNYVQHPLLQLSIRLALDLQQRQLFISKSLEIIRTLFPDPKVENWSSCKKYLPHCLKINELSEPKQVGVIVLRRLGTYFYFQGLYTNAEKFALQAVHIGDRTMGREHQDTLWSINELALILQYQGRFNEAELLQVQVLELQKEVLREKHPNTIQAMHNLALNWQAQGRLQEAEPLQVQVLELWKEVLGEKHLDTMQAMNNLASTWQAQGRFREAELLQIQVLELRKEVLGEKHPDTIQAMNNLASTWRAQGRFQEAEPLQVQVLELWKEVLGEKHPDTIRAMNNLAFNWQAQGRFREAELLQVQVLELWKEVLGEKHPDTITAMNNLALNWQAQGRFREAELLQVQVLELRKEVLGEKHPDTITAMNNLALNWQAQGRFREAEPL